MSDVAPGRRSVTRREGFVLVQGGPVPPGADAFTVGRTVVTRSRESISDELLAHELVHVRQYAERGIARFLLGYVGGYAIRRLRGWSHIAAYRRLPDEIEAVWSTRRLDDV